MPFIEHRAGIEPASRGFLVPTQPLSYRCIRQGAFFHRFCSRLLYHASSTSLWLSAPLMCGGRQDLNRPRIYLALPQSSPPYNKAQFFDKGRISPCLFRTFLIAVCAFTRCILTHTENFTPHPPGPKPGVQLFEPMRAIWLFASFLTNPLTFLQDTPLKYIFGNQK